MSEAVQGQQVRPKKRRLTEKGRALWTLALFSPVFAELMSGSSPPVEFFLPWSFAILLALYGAGVLVVRELSVIWDKGWSSIILLGAAYGILEEGIAVKSFFDPEWMDLGDLGVYGRVLETNWVWAFWLTVFHSVVSISLPIIMINLLYPQYRNERFLSNSKLWIVIGILAIDVILIAKYLNQYNPRSDMYLLCIIVMSLFVLVAKKIPKDFLMMASGPGDHATCWSPRRMFLLGFAFLLVTFVSVGSIGEPIPFQISILVILLICAVVFLLLVRKMPQVDNRAHMAHFAGGLLGFLVFIGFVLGVGGAIDMLVVAILGLLFVWDLTRWSNGLPVRFFKVRPFVTKS